MHASLGQEDPAWTRRLAALALAAVAAPYLLLALCAYPAMDDWCLAVAGREQGPLAATAGYLASWGGRWASVALLHLFGVLPGFPAAYPLLVLAGFGLAAWAAARLGGWWWAGAVLAALAAWLPSPAEGLYWLSGGICYVLPFPLLVLAGGLPERRWTPALRLLLGALAAGCSETAAILGAGGLLAACLLHDRRHAWTLAGTVVGGTLILLAPGSWARLAQVAGGAADLVSIGGLLSSSTMGMFGLAAEAWLTPLMPALVAVLLAATPVAAGRRWPGLAALVAVLGSALVAVAASLATVRMLEGRQVDAIWLHLVLGGAACAWSLLAPCPWRWRCAGLLAWWLAGWWQAALADPEPWLPRLLLTACLVGAVGLALSTWRRQRPAAVLWLALAALAAPRLPEAWGDVANAGHRRAAQWRRDAAVERLVAAGERRLAIPFLDPRRFPATSSVGDLRTGHWAATAYAAWHGLAELRVDTRITEPVPLPAKPGRP